MLRRSLRLIRALASLLRGWGGRAGLMGRPPQLILNLEDLRAPLSGCLTSTLQLCHHSADQVNRGKVKLVADPREQADREVARRRVRYATRYRTPDGHWFAPDCPPDKHGKASGATYWGCDCINEDKELSCYWYKQKIATLTRQRKRDRDKILASLRAAAPTPDAGGTSGRTPERRSAGHPSGPSAPTAPAVEDPVGPTPEYVPTPSYDEYKRNLLAALKLAGLTA